MWFASILNCAYTRGMNVSRRRVFKTATVLALLGAIGGATPSHAAVFFTPRFVQPDRFAVGGEFELTMTRNAGLGFTGKFTQGVNDLVNISGIVGVSSAGRAFRGGAQGLFDFFPDVDDQPGIGLAIQALYATVLGTGTFEASLIPYIHKVFQSKSARFEPYLALPLGVSFGNGSSGMFGVSVGNLFWSTKSLAFTLEFVAGIQSMDTTLSGGIAYFY